MLARVHRAAATAWTAFACGAGLGFVARDLAGADQPTVALAWLAGAGTALVVRAQASRT